MSSVKTDIQHAARRPGRRARGAVPPDPRASRARLPGGAGLRLALRTSSRAKGFKVERGVGGVDTAFRATLETGRRPDHRDPVRVRRAARHRARVRAQRHRDVGRGRGRGAGRGARPASRGPHPGDRHARRGGRRRQGEADPGRACSGRGLRDDDPRLRPHASSTRICSASCGPPSSTRGKAPHASADPWVGRQRARRLHPDLQRGQHAAPAGAAGLPHPRHHHRTAGRRPTSSPSTPPRPSTCGRRASTRCGSSTERVVACAEGAAARHRRDARGAPSTTRSTSR